MKQRQGEALNLFMAMCLLKCMKRISFQCIIININIYIYIYHPSSSSSSRCLLLNVSSPSRGAPSPEAHGGLCAGGRGLLDRLRHLRGPLLPAQRRVLAKHLRVLGRRGRVRSRLGFRWTRWPLLGEVEVRTKWHSICGTW